MDFSDLAHKRSYLIYIIILKLHLLLIKQNCIIRLWSKSLIVPNFYASKFPVARQEDLPSEGSMFNLVKLVFAGRRN